MPRNMPKNAIHTSLYGRDHLLHFGHLGYVLWFCRCLWTTQGPSHLGCRRLRRGVHVHGDSTRHGGDGVAAVAAATAAVAAAAAAAFFMRRLVPTNRSLAGRDQ